MEENLYMTNRQKLLFMVEELHKRGYGKLRIIPSLSPSGTSWRCSFIDETKNHELIASNWIFHHENGHSSEEIKMTIEEFADLFVKENFEFIQHCNGTNEEYEEWYSEMLQQLIKGELPYAFADYFSPTNFWKTSEGKEIKTLPNEQNYYF